MTPQKAYDYFLLLYHEIIKTKYKKVINTL